MRLRLREHSVQRKPQSAIAYGVAPGLANLLVVRASAWTLRPQQAECPLAHSQDGCAILSQKSFKKVLTPEDEISYHTRTLLKRTGNFTR